jgi:phosphate starvation-inducible protein PhoH
MAKNKYEENNQYQDENTSNQLKGKKKRSLSKEEFQKSKIELTPKQHILYKGIKNNILTAVHGPAGTSKAQPLDAPILTPLGWVTMNDINVGDSVISVDGTATTVTEVFPQGMKDIWELSFSDGVKVECCSDHLWYTQAQEDINQNRTGSVKITSDIIETIWENGMINHKIPITAPVIFTQKELEFDPYLLGCALSDNLYEQNTELTTNECEIIETINESLSEKMIPECYKINSINNRLLILRGLMDMNGIVSNNNTQIKFSSYSKQIINDVKELVQSLGGIAIDKIPIINNNETLYNIGIIIGQDINIFSSRRIDINILPYNIPNRYIVSAKLIGKKEAKCIKIDHESHLYLTNDYIVTHNTYTTCYAALSLLADKTVDKIIITKPIIESCDISMGALPGDINCKIEPYAQSFYTTFCKIISKQTVDQLFASGEIKFEALNFMRGSTYDNCIMLLDECQNVSIKQLMLWITRLGNDAKAVMMGDTSQYDVRHRDSGYTDFIKMINGMNDLYLHEFSNQDIVRNKFLIEIADRYDIYRNSQENKK